MFERETAPVVASGTARHVGNILALPRGAPVADPADIGTCDVPGAGMCDLPNCHATRLPGSGRRYCCPEHAAAARNLANATARAAAVERKALTDALDGKTPPPQHVGFLLTMQGTVLTGQALLELRAAVSVLRSAAAMADERSGRRLDQMHYLQRLREVRLAAERAAAAVEKVLPGS